MGALIVPLFLSFCVTCRLRYCWALVFVAVSQAHTFPKKEEEEERESVWWVVLLTTVGTQYGLALS